MSMKCYTIFPDITNKCNSITEGVTGCCCDSDLCIDPTKTPYKYPNKKLKCYVGIRIPSQSVNVGAEVACDGMCGAIQATVNQHDTTAYVCTPRRLCKSLGLSSNYTQLSTDRAVNALCCNEDNCNVNTNDVKIQDPPVNQEAPITCYSGVTVNGKWVSDASWQVCRGKCSSLSITTKWKGETNTAVVYTCDPASVCDGLKMRNNCTKVEDGVIGCCCDSDACIDPTTTPPRSPGQALKCYTGIETTYKGNKTDFGVEVVCNGQCGRLSTVAAGTPFTSYHCFPNSICRAASLYNNERTLVYDRSVNISCCNTADNCNAVGKTINPKLARRDEPIACYSGIQMNGNFIQDAQWTSCFGDCISLTINSTYNKKSVNATVYTCDPSTVCRQLNLNDRCHQIEPGIKGCCCSTPTCIDPLLNPPKFPQSLTCYVGLQSSTKNINAVTTAPCDGRCASLNSTISGNDVTLFLCAPRDVCKSLNLYEGCGQLPVDKDITGCCCSNSNYCNDNNKIVKPVMNSTVTDYPILCYSGIRVNGSAITKGRWTSCAGNCASVNISTTVAKKTTTAEIFTCDPSSVCTALNITNKCNSITEGVTGCCCDSDLCIDPTKTPEKFPRDLSCFVGIFYSKTDQSFGSQVKCDGKCASLKTNIGSDIIKSYHCVPKKICRELNLDDTCQILKTDVSIEACCCDNVSNCNVKEKININNTLPEFTGTPISCTSGLYVDSSPITTSSYMVCKGQCASVTYSTTYNKQNKTLTFYTCDPSTVCSTLGLDNNCNAIADTGLTTCCCNTDDCVNEKTKPPRKKNANSLDIFAVLLVVAYIIFRQ